jgi:hypothetical protein
MMSFKDAATLGIALIGAVLGIVNMWRSISRDKPKIKVIPKRVIPVGAFDESIDFSIEAINLGTVALTVSELGLFHQGVAYRSPLTIAPIIMDGGQWPRRLEPRTSVTVYGRSSTINASEHPIRCAYAMTDCGLTFEGTSDALEGMAQSLAGK